MFTKLSTARTAAPQAAGGAVLVTTELAEGHRFESGAQVATLLRAAGYLPDGKIATVGHLGGRRGEPAAGQGAALSVETTYPPGPCSRRSAPASPSCCSSTRSTG